jgi:chromate reductase, NAD(P)H dehydrogenase (quinone)
VRALREAFADADAILIATPEYNGSLPGALKNALDWASRPHATNPLRGKPAAVVGASTGLFGAVWAQAEARKVLRTIGAQVLERELPLGQADGAWAPDGTLLDPDLQAALADIVSELVQQVVPVTLAEAA